MTLLKKLFKMTLLFVVGSMVAGVVSKVKNSKKAAPISVEEWPSVPPNPEA
ncbi:MAG TPA: hypothetical protein VNF08_02440 [Acidimicrobiales bacterium]|nr:hypothetical protein [Acidimicrobiales bacterium]